MQTYEKLYLNFGIRNSGSIAKPHIVKKQDFIFPEHSIWMWSTRSPLPTTPRDGIGLLNNSKYAFIYLPTEYINPQGKYKNKESASVALSDIKSLTKFKVSLESKTTLLTPPKTLLIYNFGSMNFLHRYTAYQGYSVDRFNNRLRTIVELCRNRRTNKNRRRYITINIPALNVESLLNLEKGVKLSSTGLSKLMEDEDLLSISEIWKMMTPRYRSDSVFDVLSEDEMENITFLFQFGLGVTMFNMKTLFGLVNEYDIKSVLSLQHTTARKLFFFYLLKVKNSLVLPAAEIMKDAPVKLDNATDTGTDVEDGDMDDVVQNIDKLIEVETNESLFVVEEDTDEEVNIETKVMNKDDLKNFKVGIDEQLSNALRDGKISVNESVKISEAYAEQVLDGTKEAYTVKAEDLKLDIKSMPNIRTVVDKTMLGDNTNAIKKQYISTVYRKDIKSVIYKMQDAGILVSNHTITRVKDITSEWEDHTITMKPIGGKQTTRVIRLPYISPEGKIRTNNNNYKLIQQRGDAPIRKINFSQVGLSSYVGKLFIEKNRMSKDSLSNYINKQLNKAIDDESNPISVVVNIPIELVAVKVPVEYNHYSRTVKAIVSGYNEFNFDYFNRKTILAKGVSLKSVETKGEVLVGKTRGGYLVMKEDGDIVSKIKGKVTELGMIHDVLELDLTKAPKEFATLRLIKQSIPIGLVISYYVGINNLLNILEADYELIDAGIRIKSDIKDLVIKFGDKTLWIKKPSKLTIMTMAGMVKTKELKLANYDTLNRKDNSSLVLMGLTPRHILELDFNILMFLDPITISVLKERKEPTNLPDLMLKASELLLDDTYTHNNDLSQMVIRGYERIPGIMYKSIAMAVKEQMSGSTFSATGVDLNRFETWANLSNDSTMMIAEDLNPIAALKQSHDITYTGIGGRAMETMTPKTREYHISDVGFISEANKDSSKVGVSMYSSANPLFHGLRGTVNSQEDFNPSNILSVSAINAVFVLNDDPKRMNFVDVQNQHTMGMEDYMILPLRTGYDSVIPMRMDEDMAVIAREDGVVVSKDDIHITVLYKESGERKYVLKEWYTKEESSKAYKHVLISDLKKGDKFKPGEAILYDSMFFGRDMLNPKGVALKNGLILTAAFVENYATYEDSYEATAFMKGMLATKTIAIKTKILDYDDSIFTSASIGDKVDISDIYLQYGKSSNTQDDNTNFSKELQDSLKDFKVNSHTVGYKGVIKDIKCFYNHQLSDLTPSLKKLCKESDVNLSKKAGEDVTGRVDSTFSDSGIPVIDGKIVIKYYLEVEIPNSVGNKIVFGNQLKATNGEISNNKVYHQGRKVHCFTSSTSTEARIVDSPDKLGTTITIQKAISRRVREMMA